MNPKKATLYFHIYISLQNQFAAIQDPKRLHRIKQSRKEVLAILHRAGYRIVAYAPSRAELQTQVKLSLIKTGEEKPLAESIVTVPLTPEQLTKIIEEKRLHQSPFEHREKAFLHFSRFVNIFRRGIGEENLSHAEKTALMEACEQTLRELKTLGWEINRGRIFDYDATREYVPATFTFFLLPIERRNNTPIAMEEVVVRLSKEEVEHLYALRKTPKEKEALTTAQETADLLKIIFGKPPEESNGEK